MRKGKEAERGWRKRRGDSRGKREGTDTLRQKYLNINK